MLLVAEVGSVLSPQLLCRRHRTAPSFGADPGILFLVGILPPALEHIHGVPGRAHSDSGAPDVDPCVLFISKHRFWHTDGYFSVVLVALLCSVLCYCSAKAFS